MSRVILEEVNEVVDIVEVVDCCHAELRGVAHSCSEGKSSDSAEAVDSKLD